MTKKQQKANMVELFVDYLADAEAALAREDYQARQIVLDRLLGLTQACEAVGIDTNEIGKQALAIRSEVRANRRRAV